MGAASGCQGTHDDFSLALGGDPPDRVGQVVRVEGWVLRIRNGGCGQAVDVAPFDEAADDEGAGPDVVRGYGLGDRQRVGPRRRRGRGAGPEEGQPTWPTGPCAARRAELGEDRSRRG